MRIDYVDLFGLSEQLAYFFLLSLFPFLVFLITLLGYLPIDVHSFIVLIERYAPAEITELINTNINKLVNSQNGVFLSFCILGIFWYASNGVNVLPLAFKRSYEV